MVILGRAELGVYAVRPALEGCALGLVELPGLLRTWKLYRLCVGAVRQGACCAACVGGLCIGAGGASRSPADLEALPAALSDVRRGQPHLCLWAVLF